MSKGRTKGRKKNISGIVNLIAVVAKLQKSLLLGKKLPSDDYFDESENNVPEDVKEGHFAVVAAEDDEVKRFVVPLSCLTHPSFLTLLEQAAEEYGFDCEGALTVPCRPSEMERILALIYT
ncbi:protein SMALL AUXIN UP-REGULATED RNA 51-like [Nicotiana tabacum]|uniref:Auxin-induced protein X15-like n=1 Tax=Nicotiana tabacum TaxID=4097 RepID=A0A1S3ZT28_TOBAC|nr:auxin-induced protein X15-like [Nicotiana tomentosiformis]XP_009625811.1 auxin-induced protein X15-like [Nicotiana tomentosiformis]XP_016467453.1 PREDICTED: auxin-induced protein X15-like [Nicotiana tabacum]